jgi:hypothetical protein
MGWTLTLRSAELEEFRRCPRAWDIGSRNRQNYVPIIPREVIDFDRAIRDALAVYYFPAMDDWNRMIVRPLALHAFRRKVKEHRELRAPLPHPSVAGRNLGCPRWGGPSGVDALRAKRGEIG